MVRCSTPDTLIGLGGAGSRVVYRFMEQEWILNEALGEGPGGADHGPETLRTTTIDTATEETWHEDRAETVKATVRAAIERAEHVSGDQFLEFQGPTIIPDELPTERENEQFTKSDLVANLRSEVGLNSWWLENGRDPLKQFDARGFDEGLYRFRAMGKALFHIANQDGVDAEPVKIPAEGDVCLVTSLGGGTGSGLAIDLAASLREAENDVETIDLYGVLPHNNDEMTAKANAYAALSELEYAELAGESPFDSITLLPHLEAVEEKNAEFEMAAVRTILARQNGGASVHELQPNQVYPVSAPAYAPFTIASPVTIQYDLATREEALEIVTETLQAKRQELDAENALYDVVEQYLEEAFPNTAGAELAGVGVDGRADFDGHDRRLVELQHRIEDDLWDEFLGSDALAVADLGDTVDRIDEAFEVVCDDDSLGTADVADERKRAARFVEVVPERLIDWLEADIEPELTERDQTAYELVKTVQRELENVARRRDLFQAISRITAEEVPELSKKTAETIRTALADVILDEEVRYLPSEITSPRLREMIEDRERELARHEDVLAALGKQYETVAVEIERMRAEWVDAVREEAKRLAAIKRSEQAISEAVQDLSDRIEEACSEINRAESEAELDRIELNLDQTSPLGTEDERFDGAVPLNKELASMGLEPIPVSDIEDGFESVKRARRLELAHGGILPWRGNTEEFVTAVRNAEKSGWFSINAERPDVSIEDEFSCTFNGDKLDLTEKIEAAEQDAIDAIAAAFVETFTADGSAFVSYEPDSDDGVAVPEGGSPITVKESLKSGLRATTKTDENELLNDVMPVNDIDPSDPSSDPLPEEASERSENRAAMLQLVDAYLQPIREEHENTAARRDELTDDEDSPGLITRLKVLRGLAEGEDAVEVELPDPDDRQRSGVYGADFVDTYEGIYEFDLDDSFKYENEENPYVVPMETKPTDLAGDPDDISDTDIVENRAGEIETELRRETAKLKDNSKRAPYKVALRGNAERTGDTEYKQMRIRQVYLSRGYEEKQGIGTKYDRVYDEYADREDMPIEANPDMYNADLYPYGWGDDVTMVTFVGGIFLDNIELVSEANGYRDMYRETHSASEFPGSHHTIGLGAMWDRWSTLGEWVTEAWEEQFPDNDADFGGYVHRDRLYDPSNKQFIEEIRYRNQADDESPTELFLDAMAADAYENTVEVEEAEEDSDAPEFMS